jgi:hypothetical protein
MPTSSQRPIPSLDQNGKQKYDEMHLPSQWRRRGALRREPNAFADERQKEKIELFKQKRTLPPART